MVKSGWGGLQDPHEVFQPWTPQGPLAQTPALCQYANFCTNKSAHQLPVCTLCHLSCNAQVFFTLSVMQCQRSLQISQIKNTGTVFKLSRLEFRLALPYGVLLAQILQSLHIHFWWMDLFLFDLIEAVLCVTSTLELMPPKIHFNLTNCVGVKPLGSISLKKTHDIA